MAGAFSPLGSSTDLTNKPPSPISLVTFQSSPLGRRGQPVLVAQSETKFGSSSNSSVYNGTLPDGNQFLKGSSPLVLENHHSSDSSLLDSEASERQALLPDSPSRRSQSPSSYIVHTNSLLSGPRLNDGLDPESDDTDSCGTPGGSPAKGRILSRNMSLESGQQSFGLHSPDVVPGADVEFNGLDEGQSNGIVGALNSLYKNETYKSPRVYYDPDIIDLTNFPPPETPDDDSMLDFTELSNFPPPVFSSNPSFTNSLKYETGSLPRPSSRLTRLERSASIGNCPDFLDDDIDALIAQFTIPPPPSSVESRCVTSGGDVIKPTEEITQDEFTHLIIPPPPASSLYNISALTDGKPVPHAKAKHGNVGSRHKRSSSLDIQFMKRAAEQLDTKSRSKSLDANQNNIDNDPKVAPPSDLDIKAADDSVGDITGESPATVSQKLYSLLQSLPNFSPGIISSINSNNATANNVPRIFRSSSIDMGSGQRSLAFAHLGSKRTITMFNSVASFSSQTPQQNFSRPRSQSFDPTAQANASRIQSSSESRSQRLSSGLSSSNNNLGSTASGSESFATLKAKLRDYRDSLLNRKSRKSRKEKTPELTAQNSDTGSSMPSSLNKLFSRRGSKSDPPTANTDSNWELKEAGSSPSPQGDLVREPVNDKRASLAKDGIPVVRDPLGLSRPTLRPVTNSILNQSKSKKLGPLKALPNSIGADNVMMGQPGKSGKQAKSSGQQKQGSYKTKDDIAMGQMREKLQANPYATIKMWRPVSMTSNSLARYPVEDNYQSFSNFDALRQTLEAEMGSLGQQGHHSSLMDQTPSGYNRTQDRLSEDAHWQEASSSPGQDHDLNTNRLSQSPFNWVTDSDSPDSREFIEIPEDYSRDNSPSPIPRKNSSPSPVPNNDSVLLNHSVSGSLRTKQFEAPLPPPPPHATKGFTPPDLPSTSKNDPSYEVVSDGVSKAIKQVLSHRYTVGDNEDLANRDVERLLEDLKLTMDSIRTSRIDKNPAQLSMCVSELHSQTNQFINHAKLVVGSANSSREKMVAQLESAIHTLACLFLHGQATMLLVKSSDLAHSLGFQLIKAANAFKSTVMSANTAVGKPIDDPDMKYLMRQATNLAGLLRSLLTTIKEIKSGS
ncbi:unnamed protein product [Lymnaea stagnalis]|uniref:Uncharacterized protein n=1 Tax=Lymnaea stagnalis TaxID=6523 RepID=A0AAV2HF62_LYMST